MRRVLVARMGLALILVVMLFGILGGLLYLEHLLDLQSAPAAVGADVDVAVLQRDGTELYRGNVTVPEATALAALLAAAEEGRFTVDVETFPNGRYVRAIGGEPAEGVGGWVYRLERGDTSEYPPRAADLTPLLDGDRVVWHWTDEPIAP